MEISQEPRCDCCDHPHDGLFPIVAVKKHCHFYNEECDQPRAWCEICWTSASCRPCCGVCYRYEYCSAACEECAQWDDLGEWVVDQEEVG